MIDLLNAHADAVVRQTRRKYAFASIAGVAVSAAVGWIVLGLSVASARAEEVVDDPGRSGFSAFLEAAPQVIVQRARGSVSPNFEFSQSGKSNFVTNLVFRLGGGLKGPALASLPGQPRPVFFAAALVPINESSTIGSRLIEENIPGTSIERVEDSRFAIEYQTSATLGLGLEFQVPVLDTTISITPSIQSLHLVSRYVGRASLVVSGIGANEIENTLAGKQQITQHFVGPAVRISTPPVSVRWATAVVFLDAGLLLDVAGTRREFAVDGSPGSAGKMNFETGSGAASVTSGFQVRWP